MIEITLNENGSVSNREIFIGFTGENLDKTLHFTYPEKYKNYHKYVLVNHSVDGTFGVLPINDDKFVVSTFLTSKKYGWELQVMFTEDELDLSAETVDLSPKEGKHQKLFKKIWCGIDRGLFSVEAINAFEEDENVQLFYEKLLKVASENGGGSSVLIPYEITKGSPYIKVWEFTKTGYYLIQNNSDNDFVMVIGKTGTGEDTTQHTVLDMTMGLIKKGEILIGYAYCVNTEYQLTIFKNSKNIKTYINAYIPSSDEWKSAVQKILSDSSFSSTYNGKFLSVVDGIITPSDIPEAKNYVINVTYSEETYNADKTFDEVLLAIQSEKNVVLMYGSEPYTVRTHGESANSYVIYFTNINNTKEFQMNNSSKLSLTDYKYKDFITDEKTLVGAINELKSAIDVLKATAITVAYDEETETIDFDYVADALAEAEETEA